MLNRKSMNLQAAEAKGLFFSRILYDQNGYVWLEHLTAANYSKRDATKQLKLLDQVISKVVHNRTLAHWNLDTDSVYRVCFDPLTGKVEVTHFGIDCLDPTDLGVYPDASSLPAWIQARVAVLSMMPFVPPTDAVEGIGQRINETTFWVIKG